MAWEPYAGLWTSATILSKLYWRYFRMRLASLLPCRTASKTEVLDWSDPSGNGRAMVTPPRTHRRH